MSENRVAPVGHAAALNLLDLFEYNPVFNSLCFRLPIKDIVSLTRTCRALSHVYETLLKSTHWNVDKGLRRFVNNPRRLRNQLGQCNALISGSFVLQFFERIIWEKSDLDIFVNRQDAPRLEEYLVQKEEYSLIRTAGHDDYSMGGLMEIRTLVRAAKDGRTEEQIQIVHTADTPILAILKGFYNTVVMNVIAWNKAYAIFPYSTFVRYDGILLKKLNDYFVNQLEKYRYRGWSIEESPVEDERLLRCELARTRRVGDRFTVVIPFDTRGMSPPRVPDTVLEHGTFHAERLTIAGVFQPHSIHARAFGACVLNHTYSCGDRSDFWSTIESKLDSLAVVEVQKIPDSLRPFDYLRLTQNRYGFRELHRTLLQDNIELKKYDEEVPRWFKEWEDSQVTESGDPVEKYQLMS